MPEEGVDYKSHYDILCYEEIRDIVEVAVSLGINKVRLTGGEPLVRLHIEDLIELLSGIEGLEDIGLTTNGTQFAEKTKLLKSAGLERVNISLDTLDRKKYEQITRRDKFDDVMRGIEAALANDFNPVKINTVIMKGINENEIYDFVDLIKEYPLHVRFIELMPLGEADENNNLYISLTEVKEKIKNRERLIPATIQSNGPAVYYKIPSAKGTIGFITPISDTFCSDCNKLRLTSDGKLKPCLFSDEEINIKTAGKIDKRTVREKFIQAVKIKPFNHKDKAETKRSMHQIGG